MNRVRLSFLHKSKNCSKAWHPKGGSLYSKFGTGHVNYGLTAPLPIKCFDLIRGKRFYCTQIPNPTSPYIHSPPFTATEEIFPTLFKHLSFPLFSGNKSKNDAIGEQIKWEFRIPKVVLTLLVIAIFLIIVEFVKLQSEEGELTRRIFLRNERKRKRLIDLTDKEFRNIILLNSTSGAVYGCFRSITFLRWFPQFECWKIRQLLSDDLTYKFIRRNTFRAGLMSIIVTSGYIGGIWFNWLMFQPTKQERATGQLTRERKMTSLASYAIGECLFSAFIASMCVTLQPYSLVPAWISLLVIFNMKFQWKSVPLPKEPTEKEQLKLLEDEILEEGEEEWLRSRDTKIPEYLSDDYYKEQLEILKSDKDKKQ